MVSGDSVMMSMHPTETPVRLVDEDDLRLSGLPWPEERKRLANSYFATVERHGRGQVILEVHPNVWTLRGPSEGAFAARRS